ncbi:TonB-dependent receptor [Sphingomonas qomolangmaensis]|uniref:TonB-dependent receptor n=1 Tax=Sphingomonas qomolangmaensis TaxID=2918765 RepID=A0ABY5L9N1_9SPHN|nr:TonB-dependent receptor [Sphingomonas qomolangmaensis]UUL83679.1 TonB-dependent receptor [Sphingomonas qomolangmaensis]
MVTAAWTRAMLAGSISVTAIVAGSPAAAQDAPPPAAAPDTNDIVVTALRRDTTIQDTPAAITVFDAQTIENAGIEKPADFIALTSNVQLVETQNAGNAFVVIRGITQNRNSEPSVAVVVDGVQQVNAAEFSQELFDIEQIEVLKGPQGGLYGRNAIGGAIVITTKQPTDTLEGRLMAGIDNGFGYVLRGGLSGPISDTLKFRVSASWRDTDGYIPNTFLGEDADPLRDFSARAKLLWEPSADLSFDLRGYVSKLETQAFYYNIVSDVNDVSLPVRVNNAGIDNRDIYNGSLKIDYTADWGQIRSVTAYNKVSEIITGDAFDFLPIPESLFFNILGFDLNQSQFVDVSAISEDLRISSPDKARFSWSLGTYLIRTDRYISTGNLVDTGNGVTPVYRTPSTNPLNPQATFLADSQDNFAWAVYAGLGYEFSTAFRVDASLRYDRDERENTTLTPPAFIPVVTGFPAGTSGEVRKESFAAWQPKITATWKPVDTLTLYGGYSRGFRSGGFNQTGVGAVAAGTGVVGVGDIYEAEIADTFEIGFKSQPAGRLLTFNGSVYTTRSRNGYFFVFLAANSTQNLGNVPEVQLKGFELESALHPAPGLDINVALGVTYSEIKEFPDPAVIGNEAPFISRSTFNLGGQYESRLGGSSLKGRLRADYRRTGRTWFDVTNSTSRDPVDIVDTRVSLDGGAWSVTGFAENLFDKKYNAEFSPGGFVFKARPRIYGLEASYKF